MLGFKRAARAAAALIPAAVAFTYRSVEEDSKPACAEPSEAATDPTGSMLKQAGGANRATSCWSPWDDSAPVASAAKPAKPYAVSVDVMTWETSKEEVGHSAFRVNLSDGSSKYYSIGPGLIPSAGPLIIFPLPAGRPSYEADCATHGSKKVTGADDEAMTVDGLPKEANIILRLNPCRYDAKAIHAEAETRFSDPGMTYQLLPRVPTTKWLMGAGWSSQTITVLSVDPFGVPCDELRDALTAKQAAAAALRPTNCTTITAACLAAGRKPSDGDTPLLRAPWGITPSGLHAALNVRLPPPKLHPASHRKIKPLPPRLALAWHEDGPTASQARPTVDAAACERQ